MTRYGFTAADLDTTGIAVPPAIDPIGCVVPRVIGLSLRAARTKLARAGCSSGRVVRVASRKRVGLVVAQRPAPRAVRPEGTPVSLKVSRGSR
jgi:beta-lactam-binding protein with PASTA domain